ncbi:unnamed protein product, partial [Rotaria sordida]
MIMNTTRLMLDNTYNLFIPISDNCMKLNNNQCNTFLLYFGLPNSPITAINNDDILISTSESESEVEFDSNKLIVSDTNNNISNEIVYETFFSQLLHKFSILDTLPFEELQSELFLETCEDYLSLVGKFNSPIFAPLKADVNGNINKLRRKINENVIKFQTLYSILNDEIQARTTNARNSATDALLWLKRAFEFLSNFLHEFGIGDKTLADSVSKAYEQSLRKYHGILARSVFSFALRVVPNNTEFLRSLAIHSNDASENLFKQQIFKEMLDHSSSMSSVLQKITLFYSNHGLESTTIYFDFKMTLRTPMKRIQFGSRDLLANGGGCPVEVFCRLRPPKDNNNDQEIDNSSSSVKISSSTELTLYSSENAKNGQIRESHYEFTHILTDDVSQSAAFKELAIPLLDDLIQGKNSVLFTYGITGSGKTYTMMGPLNNPGLIPRSFDVIFNSIGSYLGKKNLLRSDRQNGYEIQSEAEILLERQRKEIPITKANNNQRAKASEPTNIRTLDMTSIWNAQLNENCSYFVFVTFVEIYNNYIYDLFDDDILNKAPQSKQLREDNRGRPYIRDVKEIEVRSSEEAIELLNMGLKRRRIAHTQLNTESSRSHSVLSMRLIQFHNDIPLTSLTKDDLTISTIHLVDLAGSERVNRAKTVGERVKEASNINSSLMVLRQCFEVLRENQAQGTSKMVPYRESKLTSFFKSYFDGEGRIRMILCVNPTADGYEEIQHALKFGELTKDVMVPRALPPPPPPPPIPPKVTRGHGVLREVDNQQQQQSVPFFTEF